MNFAEDVAFHSGAVRTNPTDTLRARTKLARIPAGYSRKSPGSDERSLDFLRCQVIQQPIAKQFSFGGIC